MYTSVVIITSTAPCFLSWLQQHVRHLKSPGRHPDDVDWSKRADIDRFWGMVDFYVRQGQDLLLLKIASDGPSQHDPLALCGDANVRGTFSINVNTYGTSPSGDGGVTILPWESALTGELVPLSKDRTELRLRSRLPSEYGVYQELMQAIAARWPEARLSLDQGPAEQPEPAAPPGQAGDEEALPAGISNEQDCALVRLWQENYTSGQIAKELGYSEGHVRNRITGLRKQYGEGVVSRRRP